MNSIGTCTAHVNPYISCNYMVSSGWSKPCTPAAHQTSQAVGVSTYPWTHLLVKVDSQIGPGSLHAQPAGSGSTSQLVRRRRPRNRRHSEPPSTMNKYISDHDFTLANKAGHSIFPLFIGKPSISGGFSTSELACQRVSITDSCDQHLAIANHKLLTANDFEDCGAYERLTQRPAIAAEYLPISLWSVGWLFETVLVIRLDHRGQRTTMPNNHKYICRSINNSRGWLYLPKSNANHPIVEQRCWSPGEYPVSCLSQR